MFSDDARGQEKRKAWLGRRERRDRIFNGLFGHGVETMIGVAAIALGGAFAGMAIVATGRDGWSFETVSGGVALTALAIWFGLFFIPKRKDD
jgi:hypothetical protein